MVHPVFNITGSVSAMIGTRNVSFATVNSRLITVPTRPILTPERTPYADPGFALSSLKLRCGSAFKKITSALGPLVVCPGSALSPLGVRNTSTLKDLLCAIFCEAYFALLLPPSSPAPCIP